MFSHSGGGQQAVQYLLGFLFLTICSISLTCLSRSLILFVSAALSLALCVASYDFAFCVDVKIWVPYDESNMTPYHMK